MHFLFVLHYFWCRYNFPAGFAQINDAFHDHDYSERKAKEHAGLPSFRNLEEPFVVVVVSVVVRVRPTKKNK